jgi:hypothetical protein
MIELSEKVIRYRRQEIVIFTCDLRGSGVVLRDSGAQVAG